MTPETITQPLRAYAERANLPVGSCIDPSALAEDPQYGPTLAREYNMCVGENAFKQYSVWMGPKEHDFTVTDRLAKFAQDNDMILRGHTLCWHQGVPKWLTEGSYSSDEVRDLLRYHIHTIVGRYKGVIKIWDVVNEAVTDGDDSDYRTDSFWYDKLGPGYIAECFRWAHEADPDVLLYYNDYEAENMGAKANRVYRLVRELQEEAVPIHGVGLQGHLINGWRVSDENRENVNRIAALGLDWQITECDIRMVLDGKAPTEEQLEDQAEGYRGLMDLCLNEPRCTGFLTWGFTDKYSWIPGFRKGQGASLPFDENFKPKPAYYAIAEALRDYAQ